MPLATRWLAVLLLLLGLALAGPVEAALTTVTVTDPAGDAVAGADVKLGTLTGKTDAGGKVTFTDVPAGSYDLRVTGEGLRRTARTVTVGTGDTNIPVSTIRWYGWMTQTPAWGGLGVGPNYEGSFLNLEIKKSLLVDFPAGGGRFPVDPLPDFKSFDYNLTLNEALFDVPIGLPGFNIGGRMRLNPALSFALGGNSVKLEQDAPGSANDTRVSGSGFSWGIGAEIGVSFRPQAQPQRHDWLEDLYLRIGYKYRDGSADVERSPRQSTAAGFQLNPALTGNLISQDGDLDWHAHTGYVHAGYSFFDDKFTPYLGFQYTYRKLALDTTSLVNVGVRVRREVSQELRYAEPQGVVGFDARPFGGLSPCLDPLFLRGEMQFGGGGSFGAQVKMIYQFNLFGN